MEHNGSHIAAPALATAYHSGFGHTALLADTVAAGSREAGADVTVIAVDRMTDVDWEILDAADGIVFGSATYMGNVSAGFQTFAEQTGRRCLNHWRCSPPSTTCIGSTSVWVPAGTARPAVRMTSTGSASGWAPARRPMSTPTRTKCIPPTCRRAAISVIGSRW